jgi:hypothetical protein
MCFIQIIQYVFLHIVILYKEFDKHYYEKKKYWTKKIK